MAHSMVRQNQPRRLDSRVDRAELIAHSQELRRRATELCEIAKTTRATAQLTHNRSVRRRRQMTAETTQRIGPPTFDSTPVDALNGATAPPPPATERRAG